MKEFLSAVQFLTRLPVPDPGWDEGRMDRAAQWFPVVGIVVGAICGAIYALLFWLMPWSGYLLELSVLAGVVLTGALHEDGLADTVDGLGGGRDRERRLEIMRDSRIGTYGAVALIFAILLRIAVYEGMYHGAASASDATLKVAAAFVAAHAISRLLMLGQVWTLPYARGLAEAPIATRPASALPIAVGGAAIGLVPLAGLVGPAGVIAGLILAGAATLALRAVAASRVGGWTGDTAGAGQIIGEITFLIGVQAWIWF